MAKKKVPITRLNKFFSQRDFELDIEMGREYTEGDLNMTVVLYKVDLVNTNTDDVYGEADDEDIRFLPPVELKVVLNLNAPENKSYNPDGSMRYVEHGNLVFGVYDIYLKEKGVDIDYGDYILYPESETKFKYFTVSNDGKIFSDNAHTIGGYKGVFRSIACVPVDESEFMGI
jgi:hypothetical protein